MSNLTKTKIGSRRYSSPYRQSIFDSPGVTLNKLVLNMSLNYRKKSQEKKSPPKYVNASRKTSKEISFGSIIIPEPQTMKSQFQLQYIIGIGGFGRVWRVMYKQQVYAMKEMSKALVLYKQSVSSIMAELKFLTELHHPFLINVFAAFQDSQNLYLVLDYLGGGDLRFHLGKMKKFSEEQTKFFIACIILGLEYLHRNQVIHRDIKPENLILDQNGYLRITDLGVAVKKSNDVISQTSGTPGYMAPEVMLRQDHGYISDFFALGVICYEFMTGKRPYCGKNRKEIRDQILSKQVFLTYQQDGWSIEAIDFINQLLQRKPTNRLTNPKSHKWFKNFPWEQLYSRQLRAPYIPQSKDNFDKHQIYFEDEENQEIIRMNQNLVRDNQFQFEGYYYDKPQMIQSRKSSLVKQMLFKN